MRAITEIIDLIEEHGPLNIYQLAEFRGITSKRTRDLIRDYRFLGDDAECRRIYIKEFIRVNRGPNVARYAVGSHPDAKNSGSDSPYQPRKEDPLPFREMHVDYLPALAALSNNIFRTCIVQVTR